MEKCNCENTGCPHGESPCKNDAGKVYMYNVGCVCDACVAYLPLELMRPDDALNSWVRRDWLNNPNRGKGDIP